MAELSNQAFYDKWVPLLADNVFQDIDGKRFEQLLADVRDSFASLASAATQPVAPAVNFDPVLRRLTATHPLGVGELEYTHNNGGFTAYAPVQVDELGHGQGEWRFRVKAATGRNSSQATDSPQIAVKGVVSPAGPGKMKAADISDSTEAGRALLTASSVAAQRALLDKFVILAGQYGIGQPRFEQVAGEDGLHAYLLRSLASLAVPAAPAAPTAGQVDDQGDVFSFLPPAGYSFAQLKVAGLPNTTGAEWLSAANSYVQNGRIYVRVAGNVAKGGLAVYVGASGSVPDGKVLTNADPFTANNFVPPVPGALAVEFTVDNASLSPNNTLGFKAKASGGTAPYQHAVQARDVDTGIVTAIGTASTPGYNGVWLAVPAGVYLVTDTVTDAAGGSLVSSARRVVVATPGAGGGAPGPSPAASFSSASDLQQSTKLVDKQVYQTLGYYEAGDLGGGRYYYDATNTTTPNGGTILALATMPGRLRLLYTEYVQARQFGMRFDAATDDTERLMVASDWVINCAGKLQLGHGTAKVSDTWTLGLPESANYKPAGDAGAFGEQNSFEIIGAGIIDNYNYNAATKGTQIRLYGTGHNAILQLDPGVSFNARLAGFSLVCDTVGGAEHGLLLNSTKFSQHEFRFIASIYANRAFSILANGGENGEFSTWYKCTGIGVKNFFFMGPGTGGLIGESYSHLFTQCLGSVQDGGFLVEIGDGHHGYNLTFAQCNLSGVVPGDVLRPLFDTMQGTYLLRNRGSSGTITFTGGRNENLSGLVYSTLDGLGGSARIFIGGGIHFDGFGAGLHIPTFKSEGANGNYTIVLDGTKFSALYGKSDKIFFSNDANLGDESSLIIRNTTMEGGIALALNAPYSKNGVVDVEIDLQRPDAKPQRYKKRYGYRRLATSPNLLTPTGSASTAAAPWVHFGANSTFLINQPAPQFGDCTETCFNKQSGILVDIPVPNTGEVVGYEFSARVGGKNTGGRVRFSLENATTGYVYDQSIYTSYEDQGGLFLDLRLVAMVQNVEKLRLRIESIGDGLGWLFLQPMQVREATYGSIPAASAGLPTDNVFTGTNTFTQQVTVLDVLASSVQNLALNTFSKLAAFVVGLATRLGSTTSADPAATTSSVSTVLSRIFGLSDRLDLLAKFIIRWDQEKRITLDNDYQGGLSYTSGQAFAFTPGAYAAGIIKLRASDYGRNGDLVAVRVTPGGKDLVFDKGAAQAFHSATGPTTLPALAGMQYIFHLVRPDGNTTDGSYWVVHSTPSTGSGGSYDDTALKQRVANLELATPTGTALVFTQPADYGAVYNGTFTVDPTGAKVGSVVFVELGAAASAPTLDASVFELAGGAYASGKRNEYGFRVAATGKIHYVINQLP